MATPILLNLLILEWDISRTIWSIEVSDGSFFSFFTMRFLRPEFLFKNLFWTFSTDFLLFDINMEFDYFWILSGNCLIENDSWLRKRAVLTVSCYQFTLSKISRHHIKQNKLSELACELEKDQCNM